MANVYATKTGNWSDTTVWNTGSLPTTSDDVYSNNFTVTIDQNITVLTLRNTSATGIAAGGGFTVSGAYTITCTATNGVLHGTVTCLTVSPPPGTTVTLNSSLRPNNTNNVYAVTKTTQGTLDIVGSLTNPSYFSGGCLNLTGIGNGITNITGNVTGSYGANNVGYIILVSGGAGTAINITGQVSNILTHSNSILMSSSGTLTIVGGLSTTSIAAAIQQTTGSTWTINITGNCQASGSYLIYDQFNSGTITINGSITSSGGFVRFTPGNPVVSTGPFISSSTGLNPLHGIVRVPTTWTNSYWEFRRPDNTTYRLFTSDTVGDVPAPANVRAGTTYSVGGSQTGTMAVPPASSVQINVPVDNTTGTAYITAADLWNHPLSSITTSGSIGNRIKNASTVDTMGAQLEAFGE